MKNIMKLKVKKLGPVTDSEIELGDVTLLLGPPNTGKSYTLRTIYAKLFPLDDYALRLVKRKLSKRLTSHLERSFTEQASGAFRDLVKTIAKIFLAATLIPARDETSSSFEDIFSILMKRIGVKGTIERRGDFFIISIKGPSINININTNVLKQATHESLHELVAELVPIKDADSIAFEPADLLRIDISFIEESHKHKPLMGTRRLLLLFEELLDYIEEASIFRRELYERGAIPLSIARYLRYILGRFGIALSTMTSIKPSIDRLELSSTINLKLRFRTHAPIPGEIPTGVGLDNIDNIERIVDNVFEKASIDPRLERIITRTTDYIGGMIVRGLADSLSETILYNRLREILRSRLELDELRFIPFGRSVFVLGLESASREPFTRSEFLHRFIGEFYSIALASYVYWTSRGRSRLLEGRLSEKQARLLEAATPLLEGKLSPDATGRLLYRDWRGSLVDLQMSSALVEEVSGLILALLSVDSNALVLVEEPEAQLHPGAQIVMALFLASLPSLCGCRVVASTHSDLLAITLSQLAVQKPSKEWVKKLLERLLPHVEEGVDALAGAVAEATGSLDLRVYEFTRKGMVKHVRPEDVLGKEVPGISKVIDELTDWAFHLASYQASREAG